MIKVGIVEDKQVFRELWREILSHTVGYTCVGAFETTEDAILYLPKLEPDVVLMDIQLPPNKKGGIDCVWKLRILLPATEFLMFTIFPDDEHIFEALTAGATGYILKNSAPIKVLEAIKELHEGGSPMSPAIARRVLAYFQKKRIESKVDDLEVFERHLLQLLSKGKQYKEIADESKISLGMVKQNFHVIYKKLEVGKGTEAILEFLKWYKNRTGIDFQFEPKPL